MPYVTTTIFPKKFLDKVKRARPVYNAARRLRFAAGEWLGARQVGDLNGRVHYNDFMFTSSDPTDIETYRREANEFIDILQRSVSEAGRDWQSIGEVMEVGCGYGRIVRELTKRIAASRIAVSDTIDSAARFTAAEFGVCKVPTLEESAGKLDRRFDLVYLLSVYTHLSRDPVVASLRRLTNTLKPGGVAVITIHGQGSAETAERYEQYWLDKSRVLENLARNGYFYERYPYYYGDYGLAWFTRPTFEALVSTAAPELAFVSYHPMEVGGHQDVFVYRKH